MTERYLLERALLPGGVADDVLVTVADGRFTGVATPASTPRAAADGATRLAGLTLPGLANSHSHAFHRALRGRTQRERGTFWTWREQMYAVAERLDPDSYHALARAVFREMVAAGITCVGEFHYLHHGPDGTPYADPNAMGEALLAAADEAGLRITLLDTLYLAAGVGRAPEGVQRRFSDGDVEAWLGRVAGLPAPERARVGLALHSVRAVPRDQLLVAAELAAATDDGSRPLHAHVSEQRAENEQCLAAYGVTPTRLLAETGHLGPRSTAVHATHLTDDDIALLGEAGAFAGFCPTTERDLGDGVGPSVALRDAGARLTLGSDSHAVIDPFEEMRAVELNERLVSEERGHWAARELLDAAGELGHASLGWPDAGRIATGARADLVSVDTGTPRTAGTGADEHTAVFAASAADVTHVVADGRVVHRREDRADIARELDQAIGRLLP